MKKLVKILLVLAAGIIVFELAILRFIVPGEPVWHVFEGKGFSCMVPESRQSFSEKNGWDKNLFQSTFGDLYISSRPLEGAPEDAIAHFAQYVKPKYETDIRVIGPGKFFLETWGKGRKYIYIFTAGKKVFWVENFVRHSSLRTYKDIVDRVMESFTVGGEGSSPEFKRAAEAINGEIIWYSQSTGILALFMLSLPLFIIAVVSAPVLALVGRLPRFREGRPIRGAEHLFAWVRHPMGFQGTLVALALFQDRLVVYSWRRPFIVVTGQEGEVFRKAGKDRIVVVQGKRSATIDVEHPNRWLDEIAARGIPVKRGG